jgi:hypothetical protein
MSAVTKPKFELGQLVATPGARDALSRNRTDEHQFVQRHQSGDWGDVGSGAALENECAMSQGQEILSAYTLDDGTRLWIITEADWSATTILLPEEY